MKKTALLLTVLLIAVFVMSSCDALTKLGVPTDFIDNIKDKITGNEDKPCEHKDEVADHVCDLCSEILSECADSNTDHNCDVCGKELSKCFPAQSSHNCKYCGKELTKCSDNDRDHVCGVCGTTLTECKAPDGSHKCDVCGKVHSECQDKDSDHKCDICSKTLSACKDDDNDHKCDACGKTLSECADTDRNHKCDLCGKTLSECADENGDRRCDLCGEPIPCEHSWEIVIGWHPDMVGADCVTVGVDVYECIICGEFKTVETAIDPEAHAFWGEEEIITNADCLTKTNGLKKVHCANEGCTAVEEVEIFYSEVHNWDVQVDEYPTCTADGAYYAVCTICQEVESYDRLSDGHYNWFLTCGESGECMECGEQFTLEHNFEFGPATCTEAAFCMNCGTFVGEPLGHADNDKDHNCDLCGEPLSECKDENKDHKCDVCSEALSACVDADNDYKCDMCSVEFEDVSYELNISDLVTGTRDEDDINGKFIIVSGTEVRNRTKTYEGVEYTKSVKIGSKTATIKISVPGTGKLSFLIQNGSSSATTQFVVLTAPDGTTKEIEFAGTNEGSPVVKVEFEVTEGEWTITRKSGTIDIFYLNLDCHMPVSPECGFEIVTPGNTDYICNTKLDLSGVRLNAVFESGKTDPLDSSLVTFDTSKVDLTKAGEYEITVSYKEYAPLTFKVKVYVPTSVELGFDATVQGSSNSAGNSVYFNHSFKEVYALGEDLSLDGLSVVIVAQCGDATLKFPLKSYEVAGFDSQTAGKKVLTVSYEYETGKTVTGSTEVYVVDADPSVVGGVYMTKVDQSYTGNIGEVVDGYNTFKTVQQALDFLAKADAGAKKVIEIAEGKYIEKLEITIPNLTVRGAGRDKTTIEWNSLYGVPDASGYEQVTDSTASVAVRDSAVNCVIENITISNYWNSVEVFDKDLGAGYSEHRALALLVQSDRFILRNSSLLGYQDTVEFFLGRQLVENCYIAGTTDFIFGTNNTTFFTGCEIHSISNGKKDGGYITAFKGMNKSADDAIKYGAIFYDCKFTAPEDETAKANTAIGRTWGAYAAVAIINCELGGHISTKASTGTSKNERYVSMSGILPSAETVQFVEFGNTGAGALTEKVVGMTMLTEEEAANYFDIAVIFGKTNGKVTYFEAWDPSASDVPADDKTYYYFEQTSSPTGTSYTLDPATKLAVGQSAELGDMLLVADGNIAWNQNSGALNMKAGAYLKFSVKAGSEVIVTAYPNYAKYTINGVGTNASTFSQYYSVDTEIIILSTGDCYLFSVIVNPGEEAPEAPELTEIKVEGVNVNYTVGTELSLEGATLKAFYSDGSFRVVDYECNTSAVNKDAAGSYDIVFTYGGKSVTVTVTYEDPNAAAEITTNTLLDFKTPDGLAAVQNNKRVEITGSVRHNGGEIQIQGTISFPVKAGTVVKVIPYGNSQYAKYTIGAKGESDLDTLNSAAAYYAENDCTVVYTGLDNNYLVSIEIICPLEEGKYVFGGSSEAGDYTGILESYGNLSVSGTCKTHSGGAQLSSDSVITFAVPAFANVVIKGYDTNYGILEVLAGTTRISIDSNACYVFSTTKTTLVTIKAANVGDDETPVWNKSYITYISVDYTAGITSDTDVNFGSEGNYNDSGIDFSGAKMRDNGGNNSQMSSGSFSFGVKAGAVIVINGYPNYTSYTLTAGDFTSEEITEVTYTYTATADGIITITAVNSNNYFYSFSVKYPAPVEPDPEQPEAPKDFEVTFGSEGNYNDSGIDFSGANMRDNGGNNSQMSSGSFSFGVKAGAVIVINGYPNYTSYTLTAGDFTSEEIIEDTYTYTATADGIITITAVNSNNYFYSFSVVYA